MNIGSNPARLQDIPFLITEGRHHFYSLCPGSSALKLNGEIDIPKIGARG